MEINIHNKCANVELNSIECGMEECSPSHSYGPAIRQCCLIHYVEKGKGIFEINGKRHHVIAGQIFYIPPKIITYYEADKYDPWIYKWAGVEGRGVEKCFENAGINADNAVFYVDKSVPGIIDKLLLKAGNDDEALEVTSLIYKFLSAVGARAYGNVRQTNGEIYVKKVMDYIHAYIHRKVSVLELSEYVNIDRSYLTALFKEKMGLSPQQYIISEKMKMACEYLETTNYDISHIAQSVGYEDLFVFSHAFKREKGISPTEYRRNIIT